QSRRSDLELRKFHHSRDQFCYRGHLHFSCCQSDEQVEKAVASCRARFEGLSGLCDDYPDQGDTVPALHYRTDANSRPLTCYMTSLMRAPKITVSHSFWVSHSSPREFL